MTSHAAMGLEVRQRLCSRFYMSAHLISCVLTPYSGTSIYGDKFDDEGFLVNHDKPFLLSESLSFVSDCPDLLTVFRCLGMANSGKNTNGKKGTFNAKYIGDPDL